MTGHWRRTTRLAGGWEVPPFLEVITDSVGAVKLDMTHATTRTRVIDLVVASAGGTITLVVPQGWGVDAQGVQTDGMNARLSSRVPTRPGGDAPRIAVRGRTAGQLKVRYPSRREQARNY